jgi:type I site-specific restriction-modification system R (restriction) subunit
MDRSSQHFFLGNEGPPRRARSRLAWQARFGEHPVGLFAGRTRGGNTQWTDADRVRRLIATEIPDRVAADKAYQNARKNSDRIEHDKALTRVMTGMHKDETELFRMFMDNESFRKWLTQTVFDQTYEGGSR